MIHGRTPAGQRARGRARMLVTALCVLSSACGPRSSPDSSVGVAERPPVPAPQAQDNGTEPAGTPPPGHGNAPSSSAPTVQASAASESSPRPDYGPAHNAVLSVRMSRDCVRRGELITAHMRGPARATIGMVVAYGPREGALQPGPTNTAKSDDSGAYDWTFVVAPDARHGPANLLARSSGPDDSQEGGGSADASFTVAASC